MQFLLTKKNDAEMITSDDLKKRLVCIKEKIDTISLPKKLRKAVSRVEDGDFLRLDRYQLPLKIMEACNSYSKTDPDATFICMK